MERISGFGFLCVSDIPKKLITKGDNGKLYLRIGIGLSAKPFKPANSDTIYEYYVTCAPKKDERVEGEHYSVGNLHLHEYVERAVDPVQSTEVPTQDELGALPF